ncbi:hypothetical protein METBIDRAFT_12047 [Metschnikowia bicuspidata var. bicuspidata NRRL YB-4993]|uniref:Uncharacterized protein n=1 Tax=Metschnikowia bicuspidata var. bicuspidata NRRL YB-4993 TaxID=869754 RepID=A0A1A0HCB9_9ASCO|nr:hypothetical protein METBIDRAFT_12047 [Metschnikowia bicuspidata var. bicuspidata NRRL YB-4993]OBA21553.1 hypothetical protein METBIDRAFT_12047 [Metschnikowia bicuspidata var. bicuspidata NRRL YB-4993]
MDLAFLRDRGFRVYKANQLPTLSVAHQDFITSLVAKYFYTKYTKSTNDLIPRYKSAEDVKVAVRSEKSVLGELSLLHLSIEHGLSMQTVVFIQNAQKTVSLIRLPIPLFLVEVLESLDLDLAFALQPVALTHDFVHKYVNGLKILISEDPSVMGQIDLVFSPRQALTGNSLRNILVTFPKEDSSSILQKESPPLDCLYDWLAKTTTLKFKNLDVSSFSSRLVAIKTNTLTLANPLSLEDLWELLLKTVLESVYI